MWLLILGCDDLVQPIPGSDTGNSGDCAVVSEGPVPSDFTTLLGYSADEVKAWLVRQTDAELTYSASGMSSFTDITATTTGDPILRDLGGACADVLALPGTLQVFSQDGSFSETFDGEYTTASKDAAGFTLREGDLNGSFDLEAAAPGALGLEVDARFTPGDTTGTFYAYGADENGAETMVQVATWVDDL